MRGRAETVKALTIHQPYAYSIVAGLKHYETRTRRTAIRGRIAIHAALTTHSFRTFRNQGITLPVPDPLAYGAVVGTVEITDCLRVEELTGKLDTLEKLLGRYTPGMFAWVLANPVMFGTPYPAKGKQGWWEWEEPKQDRACKNCKFWRPLDGVCLNEKSEQHTYMNERYSSCPAWVGPVDRVCRTCEYWEEFNGVCFNGDSLYCADFTDDGCPQWTEKKQGGGGD